VKRKVNFTKAPLADYQWRVYETCLPRHKEFGTRVLAKKFNVTHERISKIVNNKAWTHI
jgi:hypothetical protein